MSVNKEQNCKDIVQMIEGLKTQMVSLGYKPATITRYDAVWKGLVQYCNENNNGVFTLEVGRNYIWSRYGSQLGDDATSKNVNRAILLLDDFQTYGVIYGYSKNYIKKFSSNYSELFTSFLDYLKINNAADSSIRVWKSRLFRFEHFLIESEVYSFEKVELEHINNYILSLSGFSSGTISSTINILQKLFKYAAANGYHNTDLSESFIRVRKINKYRLPTVISPEEIEKVLSAVDRNNPIGKRDYAILMLVTTFGLRISDVFGLDFKCVDWINKRINIVQKKTGRPLELPLTEDVGWAIIDYLKNGRPKSNCTKVFIKHVAPYNELTGTSQRMILPYFRAAGITIPAEKVVGMHMFRHSLASSMLKKGFSLNEIANILGHSSLESTERYISVDVDMLRKCALEVSI